MTLNSRYTWHVVTLNERGEPTNIIERVTTVSGILRSVRADAPYLSADHTHVVIARPDKSRVGNPERVYCVLDAKGNDVDATPVIERAIEFARHSEFPIPFEV